MFSFFLYAIAISLELVSGYIIVLKGNGDIIQGETAQFTAEVFDENGVLSTSHYTFEWSDNAEPKHTASFVSKSPAIWKVLYDSNYPPAEYKVSVKVIKSIILLPTTVGTAAITFNVSKFLEGDIILTQGNFTRQKYVSNDLPVNHSIALKKIHLDYLNKTSNFMKTFWFVDCTYYGPRNNFEFYFNYSKTDSVHYVEALLIASEIGGLTEKYDFFSAQKQLNVLSSVSTGNLNGTTHMPNVNSSVHNTTDLYYGIDEPLRTWLLNFNSSPRNFGKSDYCLNSSVIPINPKYTYGFFRKNFTVKASVKISPINGTNWLMDGEILNINVSCNGSSPYSFCVLLKPGLYNITGNETCKEKTEIKNCSFGIQHLFRKPSEYTLVVIISNSVSTVIKPIAVNIYKVKKHAQLSVIIVPVSFSLIATILIIFGVAYYVQSKHKYTIEVADFDFGNQTSDMEYKTFRERLREAISNSFMKSNDYHDSDSSWSESVPTSRKYGSMH